MPETLSPLEYYFALMELLIKAKKIHVAERTALRSRAETLFSRAEGILHNKLGITWGDALGEFRHALECHANYRHDIPFDETVPSRRNRSDTGTIGIERCERCDTRRLRTHFDGEDWFNPSGKPRYIHSDAYKINGNRREPTLKEYQMVFGAIQKIERYEHDVRRLKGVKLPARPE